MAILQVIEPVMHGLHWPDSVAHLAVGDENAAFVWLGRGVEEHDQSVLNLKINPLWDPIRQDARFQQLLRRMNLE